jgi:hypothetical protein
VVKNTLLRERARRWIYILKVMINPDKYLDELYYLLISEPTENELKEPAELKIA